MNTVEILETLSQFGNVSIYRLKNGQDWFWRVRFEFFDFGQIEFTGDGKTLPEAVGNLKKDFREYLVESGSLFAVLKEAMAQLGMGEEKLKR